ncbi:unnamed protein product, partial [Phaeothamnion confervicola]
RHAASGRLGLCAQHGPAGQDRRSCRTHDSPLRPAARLRHRDRVHRHAAGRAPARDAVRVRGADARDRRRRDHGGAAERAADADAAQVDRRAGAGDCARRPGHDQDDPEGCRSGIRVDRGLTMQSQYKIAGKIVVASQHYPPDTSTTATIMADIACRLSEQHEVVVLSGWPGALPAAQSGPGKPRV